MSQVIHNGKFRRANPNIVLCHCLDFWNRHLMVSAESLNDSGSADGASTIETSRHIIPWKEVLLWWKLRTIYSKDTCPCREAEYDDFLSINRWLSRDPSLLLNIQYQHYSCLHISGRDMHFVHHTCIMNMFTKIMVRTPENFVFAFIKGLVVQVCTRIFDYSNNCG